MILKQRESGTVEFVLDLDTAEAPRVVGNWDSWRREGIPMVREEGGPQSWKLVLKLPPGEHQFRYRVGDHWFNDPSADRYVDNGLGGENSVVIVEDVPKKRGRRASSKRAAFKRPDA